MPQRPPKFRGIAEKPYRYRLVDANEQYIATFYSNGKGPETYRIYRTRRGDIKLRRYINGKFDSQIYLPMDTRFLHGLHQELIRAIKGGHRQKPLRVKHGL